MAQYQSPPQPPPLFTGTKESIVSDAKALNDRTRKILDALVGKIDPDDAEAATFEEVMLPQITDENESTLQSHILGFYQYVSGYSDLRNASVEAEQIMEEFGIECSMREDVYRLVDAVYQRSGVKAAAEAIAPGEPKLLVVDGIDAESARLLDKDHRSYVKNGLGLPAGPQRDRFKAIKTRLSQIQIEFQKNLNEETGGVWYRVEELDGVPQDVIDSLEKGGPGENDGKVKVTFKYPDLFPIMKFAKSPDTRRRLFEASENKVNENVPLFREAVLLRDEAARMLGYPDHATFRIEDKMAKTPKTVMDFMGDLRTRLTPGGEREVTHLLDLKKTDHSARSLPFDGNYYLWDHRFYDRLMVETEYSVDEIEISQYFPLRSTVAGMLRIFEQLFGLVFVELDTAARARVSPTGKAEDISWHEDVIIFSVWDDVSEGGEFVGYLYLDLFPRTGKYGHAADFNLQPGFLKRDGKSRHYPSTALVCNFPKPTPNKPSLLKHDDVVTLFHELGHGIHDLTGRCRYSRFHGTGTVRDFVEAPSQMLENWCWTAGPLKGLSSHWETGAPIPDDLVEKLMGTRHVNDALFNLRQLHFGLYDMSVHGPESHAALESTDLSVLYNELRVQICGLKGPEALGEPSSWGNGQATFGHLVGGYDAGYYGYLSSLVYSTDMFYSVFKANPMNVTEGRRYRRTVLEKGGSQDEMLTLVQFLGRKPSTEAFYKELGLS